MFRDLLHNSDVTLLLRAALVIFFCVFASLMVWTMTRNSKQVKSWSGLPLDDEGSTRHE
jgi:hypothetical protein